MSFRLYKEGQGTWARGTLAFIFGITGIFASVRLFGYLEAEGIAEAGFQIPVIGWEIGLQSLLVGLVLVPFGVVGVWLYNKPNLADFLIETEGELKNKVTWPTRKEATNNSIVVIVTCVLLGLWVSFADTVFHWLKKVMYSIDG